VTGSKILDLYGKMYVKESTTKPTNGTDVATKVVPKTEDNAPDMDVEPGEIKEEPARVKME